MTACTCEEVESTSRMDWDFSCNQRSEICKKKTIKGMNSMHGIYSTVLSAVLG